VNRQLLPRQRARGPQRATPRVTAAPARPVAQPSRGTGGPAGSTRVLRRPAVLALIAAACALLGVLGWTVLRSPSAPSTRAASSVLVRPTTTETGAPATITSAGAGEGGLPQSGRDPFGDEDPVTSTGRATPPHIEPTAAPTSAPTPQPGSGPGADGMPADGSGTVATVTVTVGPTYVGLYAWNGSRASFRVNARTYSVHAGATFGPGLRFTAVVPGSPRCARLQHAEDNFTLCPGQVTPLP
jgi:hypothetical protein